MHPTRLLATASAYPGSPPGLAGHLGRADCMTPTGPGPRLHPKSSTKLGNWSVHLAKKGLAHGAKFRVEFTLI